ncbi:MAG: hypothetical protein HY942_03985 [Gammaproteobacteria bacterium]|nr:hypothetical protein [Gammaproteobacteria bacterium]
MDTFSQNPARLVIEATREVLGRPAYLLLANAIAIVVLAATLWLPNYRLIGAVFSTPGVALGSKLQLLASLAAGLADNFGAVPAVAAVIVPVLFGMDVAMIVYFARQRRARLARGEIAAGLGGAASGAIAAGCAACGSFLLLPVLSFLGAAGALALLPLGGAELGLLSIALLLLSIYLIARKIALPPVCELPPGGSAARADRQSKTTPTRNRP